MSLTWSTPTKSLTARDWQSEEDFHEFAEMTQPMRSAEGIGLGVLIGLAFWVLVGISVFVGRRMGL